MVLTRAGALQAGRGAPAHRRPRRARPARRLAALAAAGGLVLSACGGGGGGGGEGTSAAPSPTLPSLEAAPPTTGGGGGDATVPTTGATAPSTARSVLPDLVVDDVGAGTKVNLASLVPSAQPVLLWFWAPH